MSVVVHIPHASQVIPADIREQFVLSNQALAAELRVMTDAYTDHLFARIVPGAKEIMFPVSRLVVDPERFRDDDEEPMSRVGMGVVYTRTADGNRLRRDLSTSDRAALIARFYDPHHEALTAAVDHSLRNSGECLVLDCHSFPSVPLPYEVDQTPERPDICIGSDSRHTPPTLVIALQGLFREAGLTTAVNRPFAGALVPNRFYGADFRVRSVMIEVNRRLYMDERTGEQTDQFNRLRELLRAALNATELKVLSKNEIAGAK